MNRTIFILVIFTSLVCAAAAQDNKRQDKTYFVESEITVDWNGLEGNPPEARKLRTFLIDSWNAKRRSSIQLIWHTREGKRGTGIYFIEVRNKEWVIIYEHHRVCSEDSNGKCRPYKPTRTVFDIFKPGSGDDATSSPITLINSKTKKKHEI